jgi:hypothetical protein
VPPVRLLEVDGVDKAGMAGGADGADGASGDAVVVDNSEEGRSLPLSIVDAFLASSTAFFLALARARRVA